MVRVTKAVFEYLHGMAFHRMLTMPSTFIALLIAIGVFSPQIIFGALLWLLVTLPLTAPIGLTIWLANSWVCYVRSNFISKQENTVLEVRIPRSIMKSPKAMEAVFNGMMTAVKETTFIDRWWHGSIRPTYSFEITSIEGELHFYVVTRQMFKEYVESYIYAQYPDVEIYEVEDYTSGMYYDPDKVRGFVVEYGLAKPDIYPIRSYVDYEVDKDPSKIEQRVDPLSAIFETLANLGPGEEYWLQIITRRSKDTRRKPGTLFGRENRWHAEAQEEIDKIYSTLVEETLAEGIKSKSKMQLRPEQKEKVEALTKTFDKDGIDVGIRLIYIARKDSWNSNRISPPMVKLWREFKSGNLNSIVPTGTHGHAGMDYPWQDYKDMRFNLKNKMEIDAFKRRSYFYPPYVHRHFVMTPEELATIYHYPTEETKTPGLLRTQSKKSEAPSNLPV